MEFTINLTQRKLDAILGCIIDMVELTDDALRKNADEEERGDWECNLRPYLMSSKEKIMTILGE